MKWQNIVTAAYKIEAFGGIQPMCGFIRLGSVGEVITLKQKRK